MNEPENTTSETPEAEATEAKTAYEDVQDDVNMAADDLANEIETLIDIDFASLLELLDPRANDDAADAYDHLDGIRQKLSDLACQLRCGV